MTVSGEVTSVPRHWRNVGIILCVVLLIGGVVLFLPPVRRYVVLKALPILGVKASPRPAPRTFAERLAYAAEDIVDPNVIYDSAYTVIPYPGGDVAPTRGVCADVVVRAYRRVGIDLQVRVHEDMTAHFDAYPHDWGLTKPDANIDHRRVFNLAAFFARNGTTLPCTNQAGDYQPGDIVVWRVAKQGHIGLVSSQYVPLTTRHLIVHNIGAGQVLEDVLFAFPIVGHYRYEGKR